MPQSQFPLALSFDDVLLVPQHNDIPSRWDSSVDLSVKVSPTLTLKLPVMSAPMDTVTTSTMAIELWKLGGLGVIHRYMSIDEQVANAVAVAMVGSRAGFAIGATGDYMKRASLLVDCGVNIFCVDIAHGDSKVAYDAISALRASFPNCTIIGGNVATAEAVIRMKNAGADAVRVSVGGGSMCSTRMVAGSGVPTLSALLDCKSRPHLIDEICIIADGGVRNSGDAIKSLAAGASCIMMGSYLAGTQEAPGEMVDEHGDTILSPNETQNKWTCAFELVTYKKFRGMASKAAVEEWRPELADKIVAEGEETLIPYKGPVKDVLYQLEGGIRSGMTYSGARTIKELHEAAQFVQITTNGLAESHPHGKK